MKKRKSRTKGSRPLVGIIMGSQSDWKTMQAAAEALSLLKIPFEAEVVSAHRTPQKMYEYAESAATRGVRVIIAGAGGAAHLPGMVASLCALPVIGVPVETKSLGGLDSLLSIAQMPQGIPVACVAIGNSFNAGLLAAQILALENDDLRKRLLQYRRKLMQKVLKSQAR